MCPQFVTAFVVVNSYSISEFGLSFLPRDRWPYTVHELQGEAGNIFKGEYGCREFSAAGAVNVGIFMLTRGKREQVYKR